MPALRGVTWFRDAWRLFKRAPGPWIGIALLFFAVFIALSFIPWVGAFIDALVLPLFIGGAMHAAHTADRGGDMRVSDLFTAFRFRAPPLLTIGVAWAILTFVLLFATNAITASYVGLPIGTNIVSDDFMAQAVDAGGWRPVIIVNVGMLIVETPVTFAAWLAAALVSLNDVAPRAALRMGGGGAFRNLPAIALYAGAGLVLALFAALPLLLGWLVFGPVLMATSYVQYRDLFVAAEPGSAS